MNVWEQIDEGFRLYQRGLALIREEVASNDLELATQPERDELGWWRVSVRTPAYPSAVVSLQARTITELLAKVAEWWRYA